MTIIETGENAVFSSGDKILQFQNLISLSGGSIIQGDSGSPIKDSKGRIVAFIVGRTLSGNETRILAMPISDYMKNIGENKSERSVLKVTNESD